MQIGHSSRGGRSGRGPKILFIAEIELASSFLKLLFDGLALLLMLFPVTILTVLIAIPDTLAGRALHEGIALLTAFRTLLGLGPVRVGVLVIFGFTCSFHRFAERHGAELLSSHRCSVLFG